MVFKGVEVAPPAVAPPSVATLVASSRTDHPGEDPHWVNGIKFVPLRCVGGGVLDPCGDEEAQTKAIAAERPEDVEFTPFAVWAGDRCTYDPGDDLAARAEEMLRSTESYQIAREFWRGDLAGDAAWPNVSLKDVPAGGTIGSAPVPVNDALAVLEAALGDCGRGQRGMIHVPRSVATLWAVNGLIRRAGNLLLTAFDTIVVADAGYDGSGPMGQDAADGAVWGYGTGMVDVRRSTIETIPGPDDIRSALDRATNTVEFRAEEFAAATFAPCCHLAIEIDAPVPDLGGS